MTTYRKIAKAKLINVYIDTQNARLSRVFYGHSKAINQATHHKPGHPLLMVLLFLPFFKVVTWTGLDSFIPNYFVILALNLLFFLILAGLDCL
ncbi:hypothetical protein Sps_05259 [Shewanella psychrophila]|uniref:Uncharacterized protein n=1 Tax=Shewanella psychrophila TaxID=225848 RepID=A0A1S6HY31_9GAMM|nr:hypothetical protein Sps_05259 [Shewanella psychrophila]